MVPTMLPQSSVRGNLRNPAPVRAALGLSLLLLPALAQGTETALSYSGQITTPGPLSFGAIAAANAMDPIHLKAGPQASTASVDLALSAALTGGERLRPGHTRPKPRPADPALAAPPPRRDPADEEAGGIAGGVEAGDVPDDASSAAVVAGPPDAYGPPMPAALALEPAAAPLPIIAPLITADIRPESFSAARSASLERIAALESEGQDVTAARIEHARILLGGMFVPEARAVIEQVLGLPGRVPPEERLKAGAIAVAIEVLGGRAMPEAAEARDATWKDARLWPALDRWLRGEARPNAGAIRAAAGMLGEQSPGVATALLPLLFDQAVGIEDADLAEELLIAGLEATDLPGTSRFLLMQGRLAQMRGDERKAFDMLASAMEFRDIHGIEARIALVDMVLARGEIRFLPRLQEILTEGVEFWRGDDLARQMLIRLASVTEELGDDIGALRTMMKIQESFPGTEEAGLAGERIPAILSRLSAEAKAGDVPLETFLTTMREFEPSLAAAPEWISARHALATMLSKAGLTRAAAAEYLAMRRDITRRGSTVSATLRDRLLVEEAEAAERAGQWAQLRTTLALPLSGEDPALVARLADIRARGSHRAASSEMGIVGEVPLEADPLEAARAAVRAQDDDRAVVAYDAHLSGGKRLPSRDIPAYLHAKARVANNGNMEETARRLGKEGTEAMGIAAAAVSREKAQVKPLSTEKARALLDASEKAAAAAEDLLGSES